MTEPDDQRPRVMHHGEAPAASTSGVSVMRRSAASRRAALLATFLATLWANSALAASPVQTDAPADPPPQVVTVTGNYYSDLRSYAHYAAGIAEFREHRHLAPAAELRFALMTRGGPLKPLPLVKASLEAGDWSHALAVTEDGWFTLPESEEALRRKADVRISRRVGGASVGWVIDLHTPGLPAQVYRLGDLRLECRVYLAIEWQVHGGRRLMGKTRWFDRSAPMDKHCGAQSVFINSRPWPRLQAYVISEGGRQMRHELDGLRINANPLDLKLDPADGAAPWSDDALVEFVFYDGSHWGAPSRVAE